MLNGLGGNVTPRLGPLRVWLLFAAGAFSHGAAQAGLPLDLGLYRAPGYVFLDFNADGVADRTLVLSPAPEYVLAADMDGDGIADIVTYRAGVWTVDYNRDGVADVTYTFGGMPGDIPLLGDIDGDGKIDLVIYRNGTWYTSTHRDGIADRVDVFGGQPGDIPMLGDLNCDGIADRIIYNAGVWRADLIGDGTPLFIGGLGGDAADRPFVADWDGDCKADLGVFRDGEWYVLTDPLASPALRMLSYGAAGDVPFAARLDRSLGSAKYHRLATRYGVFRPSSPGFYFRMTPGPYADFVLSTGAADPGDNRSSRLLLYNSGIGLVRRDADGADDDKFEYVDEPPDVADNDPLRGMSGTIALAGDLDGNGKSSLILYSAGIWLVSRGMDGIADDSYAFGGEPQDIPLVGDVDGDGRADLVIYRDGTWYVSTKRDGSVALQQQFGGMPGDIPILADVDGDGKADFGIYRNGIWYFDTQHDGTAKVIYTFGGVPGDVPLVADWNGDGRPDLIIFRAGEWYVNTTPASGGASIHESFGGAGDIPIAGNFVVETTAPPVLFAAQPRPFAPKGDGLLPPAVADYDRDGRYEPLGGHNSGSTIQAVDLASSGLGSMFSPGRVNRDCRAADFNGDGWIDLVCDTYSDVGDAESMVRLYLGNGAGGFTEDPAFAALGIRGYGETILAADFNNDGAVDLFIPFYSQNDAREHSYLLINDGAGHFTDIADAAGVALRNVPVSHRVEGAQAVDFDGDGWIDFYVAGRLFHNNGNLTFTDITDAVGLPGDFDEGIKFIDWNNDGLLDLIIHHPIFGPALWEFDGAKFTRRDVLPHYLNWNIFGLNVADLNGDGREDVIVASGAQISPVILLNTGTRFERDPISLIDNIWFSPVAAYDYDGDGAIDLVLTGLGPTVLARNISPGINRQTLTIEVVDAAGRKNQFGRVAHVRPASAPGVTMTRIVDGGSGMLSQNPYPLTIPTPYPGTHRVDVRFAGSTVSFSMQPGQRIRVYADGRTESF